MATALSSTQGRQDHDFARLCARGPRVARRLAACLVVLAAAGCGGGKVAPAPVEAQPEPPPAVVEEAPPAPVEAPPPPVVVEEIAPPAESYLPVFRKPGVTRIGFLAPLSGRVAPVGRALLNAAQLALFDHAGAEVELVPRDTGGTAPGALQAMQELLGAGVDLVIGPLLADSVRAVAPVARQARVPVIAFTNDRGVAGDGVYILGLTPGQQVARVIGHASLAGYRRFAALVPRDAYGDAVVTALYDATQRTATTLGPIEYYLPGAASAPEPVTRLVAAAGIDASGQATGYDALLIAAGGTALRTIAPLFPYYDLDPARVKFLGTLQWKDPAIFGEPSLLDGWFAGPPDADFARFAERYRAAFGEAPPRVAALGYDAMALAAVPAGRGGPDFSAAVLTDPAGYAGIDGIFRLGADGVAERGLAVYRVAPRSFEMVDPAPTAFGGPAF